MPGNGVLKPMANILRTCNTPKSSFPITCILFYFESISLFLIGLYVFVTMPVYCPFSLMIILDAFVKWTQINITCKRLQGKANNLSEWKCEKFVSKLNTFICLPYTVLSEEIQIRCNLCFILWEEFLNVGGGSSLEAYLFVVYCFVFVFSQKSHQRAWDQVRVTEQAGL